MNWRKVQSAAGFGLIAALCLLNVMVGCNAKTETSAPEKTRLADANAVVIEIEQDLPDHVGKLVTLKGKIEQRDIGPTLLGVLIRADKSDEGKVVTATGMLIKSALDPPGQQNIDISGEGNKLDLPTRSSKPRFKYQLSPAAGNRGYPIQVEVVDDAGEREAVDNEETAQ